jgi:hypothetical protein
LRADAVQGERKEKLAFFFFFLGIRERFKRGAKKKEAHDERGLVHSLGAGSKKQKNKKRLRKTMPMLSRRSLP